MKTIFSTIAMAMIPVIELRGAIPFGVAAGLTVTQAMFFSIIGNLIPIPFILFFLRRVFQLMRKMSPRLESVVEKLEAKAKSKQEIIDKYEWIGLVILVAIPLPGTGGWTGALVATVLDMRIKRAFPAIVIGVTIAGILVSVITYGGLSIFS
ncbi:MAG: small multi-drug export protein [Clostridiales bacterium]|nr:small multi-drug export protein [Clostridiales bacterium]MDD7346942.1 small multi-drug export protein [Clostridiales bacterium]MDY4061205.1 small multi-drug export protein [Anaerovoracaceae bacterium]